MNVQTTAFRPATRSEAKPLIGLYAESGCGKTWSALLLARGFVGPEGKIGMIETEGGRGEANVGREPVGQYLVRPIRQTFSPQAYGEAITDAEKAKLDALIIDSASHEWEGAGGVLAMAAKNQDDGKKGVLVWQQPKINHQRHFMLRLMQTTIPLVIVCMRAKYPMEKKGNDWARSTVLEPKQADDILFEMFVHGWIDQDHKLHVTKYTLPELASVIVDNEPISIATGQRLATWAKGGAAPTQPASTSGDAKAAPSDHRPATDQSGAAAIIPSWEDYCERWTVVLEESTDAKQLHTAWTNQKDTRNKITWPEDDTFDKLRARVTDKIAKLKEPA
jgi:hypothetical protein